MSGPKISEAELKRLEQERLERERQEALRRLQEAQSAYNAVCASARKVGAKAKSELGQVDAVYRADIESKVMDTVNSLRIVSVNSKDPADYYSAAQDLENNVRIISQQLDDILSVALQRSKNSKAMNDSVVDYQSFVSILGITDDEVNVVKIDFNCQYDKQLVQKQLNMLKRHYNDMMKRSDIPDLPDLAGKAVCQIDKILSTTDWDEKAVRSFMQKCINEEEELLRLWKKKKALYDEYLALATLTDTVPRSPEDFKSVADLSDTISEMKYLHRKRDEMDYIADQINEVMVDLGYTFVTSRVLTKNDNAEMDFSLYQADEETGIAVYTDQSGAVMMRMTVLGDDPDISDADREFSYQRQIDFCAGHPEIVDALAERGVYLKQKSYKAPDKAHTYKMNAKAQSAASGDHSGQKATDKNQKVNRRKRRRAGNKKMRAM